MSSIFSSVREEIFRKALRHRLFAVIFHPHRFQRIPLREAAEMLLPDPPKECLSLLPAHEKKRGGERIRKSRIRRQDRDAPVKLSGIKRIRIHDMVIPLAVHRIIALIVPACDEGELRKPRRKRIPLPFSAVDVKGALHRADPLIAARAFMHIDRSF